MNFLKGSVFRRPHETYNNIFNGCAPGVHAAIVKAVESYTSHRSGLLDLGAGHGALLARFRDAGFSDLHAVDLGGEALSLPGVSSIRVDLNGTFGQAFSRKFKIVVSSEVVEHLESPRNFIKQARELLDDDGLLVLSTPNIGFWEGRLKFFLTGTLWGFAEKNYRGIRHISPLPIDQLKLMMSEIGLDVVSAFSVGSFATLARWTLFSPIWVPMRLTFGPLTLGEAIVIVAHKGEPDESLMTPADLREVWKAAENCYGRTIESN
jgi:2-polyprenyl-6-hydroxyphenyl methylase/3-demethylubiquinone-9 3-methyltransferase